jgi:predicted RNA polymerase sigma factor
MGLLALMLLHESRRAAQTSGDGDLILLEQQDRSLWNKEQIAEGISLTEIALRSRRFGAYTLQAAIAAVHAESSSAASTDCRQIGQIPEARASYEKALALASQEPDRRFLARRLAELKLKKFAYAVDFFPARRL